MHVFMTNLITSQCELMSIIGQCHAKRDPRTYAKSVDQDQPPRLQRSVWPGSSLFDTRHINGTYIPCCVNNLITYMCFQHRKGTDLGLHSLKCPKVPFRETPAIIMFSDISKLADTFSDTSRNFFPNTSGCVGGRH